MYNNVNNVTECHHVCVVASFEKGFACPNLVGSTWLHINLSTFLISGKDMR